MSSHVVVRLVMQEAKSGSKAVQKYFECWSVVGRAELAAAGGTDEVGVAAAAICVALAPAQPVLYALPLS